MTILSRTYSDPSQAIECLYSFVNPTGGLSTSTTLFFRGKSPGGWRISLKDFTAFSSILLGFARASPHYPSVVLLCQQHRFPSNNYTFVVVILQFGRICDHFWQPLNKYEFTRIYLKSNIKTSLISVLLLATRWSLIVCARK